MNRVMIVPNTLKDTDLRVTKMVVNKLLEFGIMPLVDREYFGILSEKAEYFTNHPQDAELVLVIGGDGSVIEASKIAISMNIPLLGVNLGNLGYLSEVEPNELDVLKKLKDGDYILEEKMLLELKIFKGDVIIATDRLAVNDIIVSHAEYLGIADIGLENNTGEIIKYRADSVILSTPTGSTAYALSAGGPIISHDIDSITATPVSPHSFFNRSIVYGANDELKASNIGNAPLKVSIDGRYFDTLLKGDYCKIKKSDKRLKMLTFSKDNMVTDLLNKLKILSDIK